MSDLFSLINEQSLEDAPPPGSSPEQDVLDLAKEEPELLRQNTPSYDDGEDFLMLNKTLFDEVLGGASSGVRNMQAAFYGLSAGINLAQGEGEELNFYEDMAKAMEYQEKGHFEGPTIKSYKDVDGYESLGRYVLGLGGEVIPFAATVAASGGVGAMLGRAAAGGAARSIGFRIAEAAEKRLMTQLKNGRMKHLITKYTPEQLKGKIKSGIGNKAIFSKAARRIEIADRGGIVVGGTTGVTGLAGAIEGGGVYARQIQEGIYDPNDAIVYGVVAGLVESLGGGLMVMSAFGRNVFKGFSKKALPGAAGGSKLSVEAGKELARNTNGIVRTAGTMGIEMSEEVIQAAAEIAADRAARGMSSPDYTSWDNFSEAEQEQLINAGISGLVGGAALHGVGSVFRGAGRASEAVSGVAGKVKQFANDQVEKLGGVVGASQDGQSVAPSAEGEQGAPIPGAESRTAASDLGGVSEESSTEGVPTEGVPTEGAQQVGPVEQPVPLSDQRVAAQRDVEEKEAALNSLIQQRASGEESFSTNGKKVLDQQIEQLQTEVEAAKEDLDNFKEVPKPEVTQEDLEEQARIAKELDEKGVVSQGDVEASEKVSAHKEQEVKKAQEELVVAQGENRAAVNEAERAREYAEKSKAVTMTDKRPTTDEIVENVIRQDAAEQAKNKERLTRERLRAAEERVETAKSAAKSASTEASLTRNQLARQEAGSDSVAVSTTITKDSEGVLVPSESEEQLRQQVGDFITGRSNGVLFFGEVDLNKIIQKYFPFLLGPDGAYLRREIGIYFAGESVTGSIIAYRYLRQAYQIKAGKIADALDYVASRNRNIGYGVTGVSNKGAIGKYDQNEITVSMLDNIMSIFGLEHIPLLSSVQAVIQSRGEKSRASRRESLGKTSLRRKMKRASKGQARSRKGSTGGDNQNLMDEGLNALDQASESTQDGFQPSQVMPKDRSKAARQAIRRGVKLYGRGNFFLVEEVYGDFTAVPSSSIVDYKDALNRSGSEEQEVDQFINSLQVDLRGLNGEQENEDGETGPQNADGLQAFVIQGFSKIFLGRPGSGKNREVSFRTKEEAERSLQEDYWLKRWYSERTESTPENEFFLRVEQRKDGRWLITIDLADADFNTSLQVSRRFDSELGLTGEMSIVHQFENYVWNKNKQRGNKQKYESSMARRESAAKRAGDKADKDYVELKAEGIDEDARKAAIAEKKAELERRYENRSEEDKDTLVKTDLLLFTNAYDTARNGEIDEVEQRRQRLAAVAIARAKIPVQYLVMKREGKDPVYLHMPSISVMGKRVLFPNQDYLDDSQILQSTAKGIELIMSTYRQLFLDEFSDPMIMYRMMSAADKPAMGDPRLQVNDKERRMFSTAWLLKEAGVTYEGEKTDKEIIKFLLSDPKIGRKYYNRYPEGYFTPQLYTNKADKKFIYGKLRRAPDIDSTKTSSILPEFYGVALWRHSPTSAYRSLFEVRRGKRKQEVRNNYLNDKIFSTTVTEEGYHGVEDTVYALLLRNKFHLKGDFFEEFTADPEYGSKDSDFSRTKDGKTSPFNSKITPVAMYELALKTAFNSADHSAFRFREVLLAMYLEQTDMSSERMNSLLKAYQRAVAREQKQVMSPGENHGVGTPGSSSIEILGKLYKGLVEDSSDPFIHAIKDISDVVDLLGAAASDELLVIPFDEMVKKYRDDNANVSPFLSMVQKYEFSLENKDPKAQHEAYVELIKYVYKEMRAASGYKIAFDSKDEVDQRQTDENRYEMYRARDNVNMALALFRDVAVRNNPEMEHSNDYIYSTIGKKVDYEKATAEHVSGMSDREVESDPFWYMAKARGSAWDLSQSHNDYTVQSTFKTWDDFINDASSMLSAALEQGEEVYFKVLSDNNVRPAGTQRGYEDVSGEVISLDVIRLAKELSEKVDPITNNPVGRSSNPRRTPFIRKAAVSRPSMAGVQEIGSISSLEGEETRTLFDLGEMSFADRRQEDATVGIEDGLTPGTGLESDEYVTLAGQMGDESDAEARDQTQKYFDSDQEDTDIEALNRAIANKNNFVYDSDRPSDKRGREREEEAIAKGFDNLEQEYQALRQDVIREFYTEESDLGGFAGMSVSEIRDFFGGLVDLIQGPAENRKTGLRPDELSSGAYSYDYGGRVMQFSGEYMPPELREYASAVHEALDLRNPIVLTDLDGLKAMKKAGDAGGKFSLSDALLNKIETDPSKKGATIFPAQAGQPVVIVVKNRISVEGETERPNIPMPEQLSALSHEIGHVYYTTYRQSIESKKPIYKRLRRDWEKAKKAHGLTSAKLPFEEWFADQTAFFFMDFFDQIMNNGRKAEEAWNQQVSRNETTMPKRKFIRRFKQSNIRGIPAVFRRMFNNMSKAYDMNFLYLRDPVGKAMRERSGDLGERHVLEVRGESFLTASERQFDMSAALFPSFRDMSLSVIARTRGREAAIRAIAGRRLYEDKKDQVQRIRQGLVTEMGALPARNISKNSPFLSDEELEASIIKEIEAAYENLGDHLTPLEWRGGRATSVKYLDLVESVKSLSESHPGVAKSVKGAKNGWRYHMITVYKALSKLSGGMEQYFGYEAGKAITGTNNKYGNFHDTVRILKNQWTEHEYVQGVGVVSAEEMETVLYDLVREDGQEQTDHGKRIRVFIKKFDAYITAEEHRMRRAAAAEIPVDLDSSVHYQTEDGQIPHVFQVERIKESRVRMEEILDQYVLPKYKGENWLAFRETLYNRVINYGSTDGIDEHNTPVSWNMAKKAMKLIPSKVLLQEGMLITNMNEIVSIYVGNTIKSLELQRRMGGYETVSFEELTGVRSLSPTEREEALAAFFRAQKKMGIERKGLIVWRPNMVLDNWLEEQKQNGTTEFKHAQSLIDAVLGRAGSELNPALRATADMFKMVVNMVMLPWAIFTALMDLGIIMSRSGPLSDKFSMVKQAMRETFKDEGRGVAFAKSIGSVTEHGLHHALVDMAEAGDRVAYNNAHRKLMVFHDKFFTFNGMFHWSKFNRILGSMMGKQMIEELGPKAAKGDEEAILQLSRLGLTGEEVQVWIEEGEMMDPANNPAHMRIALGINRFVDSVHFRPNAADKTASASHPLWGLTKHLQDFLYLTKRHLLDRFINIAQERGYGDPENLRVMITLLMYLIPLSLIGIAMRDEIYYLGSGKEAPDRTLADYVSRTGMLGPATMLLDIMKSNNKDLNAYAYSIGGGAFNYGLNFLTEKPGTALSKSLPVVSWFRGTREMVKDAVN